MKGKLGKMLETINKCAEKISEGDTTDEWPEILKYEVEKLKDFQSLVLEKMNDMKVEPKVEVFDIPVDIGMKVRCKITEFEGIVTVKTSNLHRVPQFLVQSKKNSLGSVGDAVMFDAVQLEVICKEPIVKVTVPEFTIELGQCVKDTITNFKGTVIARELHMNGCVRIKIRTEFKAGDETSMHTAVFDEASVVPVEQRPTVKPAPKRETRGCAMVKTKTNWN